MKNRLENARRQLKSLFFGSSEGLVYHCSSPQEALYHAGRNRVPVFDCPISLTVKQNGLSYAESGYHPFVECVREFAAIGGGYEGSLLEKFYEKHQPRNAAEALIVFDKALAVRES